MKKIKVLTVFCVVTIGAGALAFKSYLPTRGQTPTVQQSSATATIGTKDSPSPSRAPEHVVYRQFFRHLAALNQRAAAIETHGKSGKALRAHYKNKMGLKDRQVDLLDEIAAECERETAKIDALAQKIIDAARKLTPNGLVTSVAQLPPPPPELKKLQRKRDMIVMRARHRLVTELGAQGFQQIDDYIKLKFARDVQPTALRAKQAATSSQGGQ